MLLTAIVASPAAGPLTLKGDLLKEPTTKPPIIPEIKPERRGTPEACAIPRQRGMLTKNTAMPAGKSYLRFLKTELTKFIIDSLENYG
jgi:hypothetical protein